MSDAASTVTNTTVPATEAKTVWTAPVLEQAGTIHDVQGGARPGNDGNGVPAALS